MSRFALVCVLGACAALAPAAPVPPAAVEKERIEREWGRAEGAGEFEWKGKQLTIRSAPVGGSWFHKSSTPGVSTVSRRVRGNFTATVTLLDASGPSEENKSGREYAGTWAGLFVGTADFRYEALLEQYYSTRADGTANDEPSSWATLYESTPMSGRGGGAGIERNRKTIQFRLTRRGNVVEGRYRIEGKEWSESSWSQSEFAFPNEIHVGVFVSTGDKRSVCATFADLTIEPLKPEPKK